MATTYGIRDKERGTWLQRSGAWKNTRRNIKTYKTKAIAEKAAVMVCKARGGTIEVEKVEIVGW